VKFRQATTSVGDCSHTGSQITCKLGTVAPGAEATIMVTVVPISGGSLRNTASVIADGGSDLVVQDNGDVADVQVVAPRARWTLSKRTGRRVLRGGEDVRFSITVRTRGRAVAGARVCDRLPAGLVFVRARDATFRKGRACWNVGYLPARSSRKLTVVARAERGFSVRNVRNVAVATAANAARRRDGARVRIDPAFGGAGGGVTG
jgi:uncharacterized repeat protein (TIGR01451 family)